MRVRRKLKLIIEYVLKALANLINNSKMKIKNRNRSLIESYSLVILMSEIKAKHLKIRNYDVYTLILTSNLI